jgi:hypothetical protein
MSPGRSGLGGGVNSKCLSRTLQPPNSWCPESLPLLWLGDLIPFFSIGFFLQNSALPHLQKISQIRVRCSPQNCAELANPIHFIIALCAVFTWHLALSLHAIPTPTRFSRKLSPCPVSSRAYRNVKYARGAQWDIVMGGVMCPPGFAQFDG